MAALVLVLFAGVVNASADLPSSWALVEVEAAEALGLVPAGLVLGYRENTTRQEFCHLVMNLVKVKTGMTISSFSGKP